MYQQSQDLFDDSNVVDSDAETQPPSPGQQTDRDRVLHLESHFKDSQVEILSSDIEEGSSANTQPKSPGLEIESHFEDSQVETFSSDIEEDSSTFENSQVERFSSEEEETESRQCMAQKRAALASVYTVPTFSASDSDSLECSSVAKKVKVNSKHVPISTQTLLIGPIITNTNCLLYDNNLVDGDNNNKGTQTIVFGTALVYSSNLYTKHVKLLNNGSVLEIFSFGKAKNVDVARRVNTLYKISGSCDGNISACISKIYRIQTQDKKLRGLAREQYRILPFTIPTETISSASHATVTCDINIKQPNAEGKLDKLKEQMTKRRKTVTQTQERNKQLKRKLQRKEEKLRKLSITTEKQRKLDSENAQVKAKKSLHKSQTLLQRKATDINKVKAKLQRSSLCVKMLKKQVVQKMKTIVQNDKTLKEKEEIIVGLQLRNDCLNNGNRKLEMENEKLKNENNEFSISVDYLQDVIQDQDAINVYNADTNTYSNDIMECAINLTDLKVATKNVAPVIKEVAHLCGKKFNNLPSRTTVDNFVDRKIALAQKQVREVAGPSTSTTLYTDETRKHGHTFQTYIISDEHNSYMLGLREMSNKSASATLDTFQEILNDISEHCEKLSENNDHGIGYKLLCNIKNTMSDRASTEKKFNTLLQEYRDSILPRVFEKFHEISQEEQQLCGQMNNFFCGLHLLVGMADVCEASLKRFELAYNDVDDIGSAARPELKRYHKAESGTLRLLRTSSKSFAMGEDEKSGVFLPWKTFLKNKGIKNNIIRFKHNRFNMIFMIAGAVYYHSTDIPYFLETVNGTTNNLMKAVSLDAKELLYLAGARVLGLSSKFVTSPLWRLIEAPGHILDINKHFKALIDFLESVANNLDVALEFMKGESSPFHTVVDEKDVVLAKLMEANDKVDEIALPMMQNLSAATRELLVRMIPEHLPEGKFWEPSEAVKEETKSARKHNKMPEFVFGQLDHLISYRPNVSLLANEAYIMYAFNNTSKWLSDLPDVEKNKYMEESRKEGREIRKTVKIRVKDIEQKLLQQQTQRQIELEQKEKARLRACEKLTNDVCFYGLWQSIQQVDEAMEQMNGTA